MSRVFSIYIILLTISGCSKDETDSNKRASSASTAESQDVVLTGTLAINNIDSETLDKDSLDLRDKSVDLVDDTDKVIASARTGSDGSYVISAPGALAIDSGASLTQNPPAHRIRSVISDTKNGSVIGLNQNIDFEKRKGKVLALGQTEMKKITAIRGIAKLGAGNDHTGISVYIPGTSYAARTDIAGNFLMIFLEPGEYSIAFEKDGFESRTIEGVEVLENETTILDPLKLNISGGTGAVNVTQIGKKGLSNSLNVSFQIQPGDADRFKAGLISEVGSASYVAIQETYTHTFEADDTYILSFVFADADGFETTITKAILVDTNKPDASTLTLVDRTSLSSTSTNESYVIGYHSDCDDIDLIAILPSTETELLESDFEWNCLDQPNVKDVTFKIADGVTNFAYKIWAMDRVGNISDNFGSGSIQLDSSAPSSPPFSLKDPITNNTSITAKSIIEATISDCTGVDYYLLSDQQAGQPNEEGTWLNCVESPQSITINSQDAGLKTFYLWSKDEAGNISTSSSQDTIIFDNRLPGIPAFYVTDATSGSINFTDSTTVKLSVSSCSNIDKIAYGESMTTEPSLAAFTDTCTTTLESFNYTFSNVSEGIKSIYMWSVSPAGVVSNSPEIAQIELKTTLPSIPTITVVDETTFSSTYVKSANVLATAADCTGISRVLLSFSQSTQPNEDLIGANCTTASNAYTVSVGSPAQGNITPYIWIKDDAGNINGGALTGLTFDTIAPSSPTFSMSDQTSGSTDGTDITTVNVTVDACVDVNNIAFGETLTSKPDLVNISTSCSTSANAFTYTMQTNIEEEKTIYLWAADAAGNISSVAASAQTVLDRTLPTTPTLSLADPTPSNSGYSNSTILDVSLGNCSDVAEIMISESQSTQPSENDAGWINCATSGIQVTAGGVGNRTFYAWAKDIGGNVASLAETASIEVDTVAPSAPVLTLKDTSNDSISFTNAQSVTAQIASCTGIDKIYLSETNSAPAEAAITTNCTGTVGFTLADLTNETKTVYIWAKDLSGNVSVSPANDAIVVDTLAPDLPSTFTIDDSTNASTTFTNSTTLDYVLSDCPADAKILIKEAQSSQPPESASFGPCSTSGTFSLVTSSQGSKSIYLWVKDDAGNVKSSSLSKSIIYDSIAPNAPTFDIQDDDDASSATYTNNLTNDLTISSGHCSDVVNVYFSESTTSPTEASFSVACSETADQYQHTFSGIDGVKTLYVWGIDAAGNVSSSYSTDSITYDTSTPSISDAVVTELATDEISISWSTSEPIETELNWGTVDGVYPNAIGPTGPATTSHSVTIDSLTEMTEYFFEIVAKDYAEHTGTPVEQSAKTIKLSKIFHESSLASLTEPTGVSSRGDKTMVFCDVNVDGKKDLIYANPNDDVATHTDNGAVYVKYGVSGASFSNLIPSTNVPDITYYGEADSQFLGKSVHCGDFDDDGNDDILMVTHDQYAYMILGDSDILTGSRDLATPTNYEIRIDPSGTTLFDTAGVGDVNGDGYSDWVLCTTTVCSGYFGASTVDSSSDFDFDHRWPYGTLGILDIDGDGKADLAVGDRSLQGIDGSLSNAGGLTILRGGALSGSYDDTDIDYFVYGEVSSKSLSLPFSGDFDGDGFADVVMKHYFSSESYDHGLFFGMSITDWGNLTIANKATYDISTEPSLTEAGAGGKTYQFGTVAIADVDNDSKDDIFMGNPDANSDTGEVCLYLGRSQANWASDGPEFSSSNADLCFQGADTGDFFGLSIATGDFDGDGTIEIAIGAPKADGSGDSGNANGEIAIIHFELPSERSGLIIDLSPYF